jgi:hypothetical protein
MAENRENGRNGRNWKKLLGIYLVVGAAVYGLIFLLLRYGGDGSGGGIY